MDCRSGRAWLGSTSCELGPHWKHCFNSLTALGKLLTTNVHPLHQGVNGSLAKTILPGITFMEAMGVYMLPRQVEIVLECISSVIKTMG